MKFYILGASGFMGSHCVKYLTEKGHEVLSERIEITDFPDLKSKFSETKPDVVINFAGARAYPNIDWCEDHKEETIKANVLGATNVCLAALESEVFPIQITSGCIYVGGPEKEFTEEDAPNFYGSFYSRARIILQDILKELSVLQIRIRMPIASYSNPRNLINKIVSYKKVISIPNSVTLVEDLMVALEKLSIIKPTGILNVVNDGYITHDQILDAYKNIVDPSHSYEPITVEELQTNITKAQRSNCVLSNKKLRSLGIEMPALTLERLKDLMIEYKKSL